MTKLTKVEVIFSFNKQKTNHNNQNNNKINNNNILNSNHGTVERPRQAGKNENSYCP